ncbi:hypothetical protein K239x_28040 [Planctomycetes bacterium K23_9]|uniref:Uncharacterized protein n=1 Tax=Stieleria marina TaxID=1930275 RepID=A0A517NUN6_9BACT|nr:hypothetical protein K239x_28040 [Planctomycetes bacterium K23_9]
MTRCVYWGTWSNNRIARSNDSSNLHDEEISHLYIT